MKEGWNVVVRYDEAFASTNVWLVHKSEDREIIVNPVDLTQTSQLHPGETPPEPTFSFRGHNAAQFLQGLADGLVEAGFKPDAIKVADKQVEALTYHLEDMRKLVFDCLMCVVAPPVKETRR